MYLQFIEVMNPRWGKLKQFYIDDKYQLHTAIHRGMTTRKTFITQINQFDFSLSGGL